MLAPDPGRRFFSRAFARRARLRLGVLLALAPLALDASPAGARSSRIAQVLDRVSPARIQQDVVDLVRLGDRSVASPAFARATSAVAEKLRRAGLQVELDPFLANGIAVHNVMARVPGSVSRQEILVGAHYDAIAFPDGTPAPGAEDNASGVAALLELGRLLASQKLATPVRLVAFAAEELGLKGSQHLAAKRATDFQAVINLDMVGYDPRGRREVILDGYPAGRALAARLARANSEYAGLSASAGIFSEGRSDHRPFAERGVPALTVASAWWQRYPHYHSDRDLPDSVDEELIADVVRATAAQVLLLAGFADGPPVAGAGAFVTCDVGEEALLSGATSFDPRGRRLSFTWTPLDGPAAAIRAVGADSISFVPSEPGAYRFLLTVGTSDGRTSEPDLGAVIVRDPGCALAGAPRTGFPLGGALLLSAALALRATRRRSTPRPEPGPPR